MARVFLSYDHDDEERAVSLRSALEKSGHDVWWDRQIHGGAQYNSEIESAVASADAVVVLWSERAVQSAWVRDEAAEGRDQGKLVPVTLDGAKPPMGFRQFQTIDLSNARGRKGVTKLNELLAAIEKLGGAATVAGPAASPSGERPALHLVKAAVGLAVVVVLAAAAFFLLRGQPAAPAQTVAVMAVDPAAEPLARDLVVNLAALQSARSGSMKLIDLDEAASRADLTFEIGGDVRSTKPAANLVLMTGKDRTILWSEDFEQEAGGAADLKQRVGFAAARVLGCALEALSPENGRLRHSLLKLYLNACAQLDETFFHDASQVIPILEKVAAEAPGFKPAWAKLLVAETNHYQNMNSAEQKAYAGKLRRTITAARQVDPDIPEAYVAEIELLPGGTFYEQIRLIDRAAKLGPDNVFVLAGRSLAMLGVGRMEQAVEDARRAASLDPLSPAIRSSYIEALTLSGQIETARSELANAERLWPNATTIMHARHRLILRYGNAAEAAEALRLMQSGRLKAGRASDAFVRARLNPTQANIDRAVEVATSVYEARPALHTTYERYSHAGRV